ARPERPGRACARGKPRSSAPRTGPGVEEGAWVRIRLCPPGCSPRASKADLGLGGLEGVQPLGDRTLAVGWLVLVDDALADSLVQGAGSGALLDDGLLDVPGFSGQTEPADGGLQRRTNRLVADTGLLVLPVALDLRLDVRHAKTCSS